MIGGSIQRIPVFKVRGGYFELYQKNEQDLDPRMGIISPVKKEDGAVIGFKQTLQYLTGVIKDIQIQKRFVKQQGSMVKRTFIDLFLDSGGTDLYIEIQFSSAVGKAFAASLRNVVKHLDKNICFKVWQSPPKDGSLYGTQGLLMYPGVISPPPYGVKSDVIRRYFVSSDYTPEIASNLQENVDFFRTPKFEKEKEGDMVFDGEALVNYLYKDFREVVYSVFGHYESADQAAPTENFAPPVQQTAPPVQQNYPPHTANGVPPQYNTQSAPPVDRPQREASLTPPPMPNYNAPVIDVVAPEVDKVIPERAYRERTAPPVVTQTPPPTQSYNPNGGMQNRSAPVGDDSFEPLSDDDLPF